MSGMASTVLVTILGFVVLFGGYLALRYDFLFKKDLDERDLRLRADDGRGGAQIAGL